MPERWDARAVAIFGKKALRRLRRSRVAAIGVGLLGGTVVQQLGRLAVPLVMVDPGFVEPENVAHQDFSHKHVGLPKVDARAAQISDFAPGAKFRLLPVAVEEVGLGEFTGVDLILTGLDSRVSRIRVAEISQRLRIRWIDLSVDGTGERLAGTISHYDPRQPDAACQGCPYDAAALQKIRTENRAVGCPDWRSPGVPATPPTLAAPAFGAVIAGIATTRAVSALLGEADGQANTRLYVNADAGFTARTVELARSPHCPFPHTPLSPIQIVPPRTTIGGVARQAAKAFAGETVSIRFHHRSYVRELFCPITGQTRTLPRLSHAFRDEELVCADAHADFVPIRLLDRLERVDLQRLASMRWQDLGLPPSDIVSAVADDGGERHFQIGRSPLPHVFRAQGEPS